jgi:hypothetical protein
MRLPETAKASSTMKAVSVVFRLIARFASGVALDVSVMNTDVTINGLMITMRDENATRAKERASCTA